jgi:hypothetical protein
VTTPSAAKRSDLADSKLRGCYYGRRFPSLH